MNLNFLFAPFIPFVWLAFGVLFFLLILLFVLEKKLINREISEKKKYSYQKKQLFMTPTESSFYKELVRLVGNEYFIFAQVHLSTIVDEKIRGQDWRAARAHIDRKSVDFVLCDKENISIKLAIELDDWSHDEPKRQERDKNVEKILEEAGVPLLRVLNSQDLEEKIKAKLQTPV